MDAIYTVLKFAASECKKYGQQTCAGYARALRAHFLTQLALIIIIFRKAEIDDLTIEQIVCLHESVMDNNISPVDVSESPALIRVVDKIEAVKPVFH